MSRARSCLVLAMLVASAPEAQASDLAQLKAKILLRALAYDRALGTRAGDEITVAVVYVDGKPDSTRERDDMLSAFNGMAQLRIQNRPLRFLPLEAASARAQVATLGVDVLYVPTALVENIATLAALAIEHHIATLTEGEDSVRRGLALGVKLADGKPVLLVNPGASRRAGLDLASDLMRVAQVVE